MISTWAMSCQPSCKIMHDKDGDIGSEIDIDVCSFLFDKNGGNMENEKAGGI